MSDLQSEVLERLIRVRPLQDGAVHPRGAADDEIQRFEDEMNVNLPSELRSWLKVCDGALVNPGCVYGLNFPADVNIGWYLREYPGWAQRRWFPIASDGCGDIYILDCEYLTPSTSTHPVVFLDQSDFAEPSYIVASGLLRFLFFLFESEIVADRGGEVFWPTCRDKVVAVDPAIEETTLPLPWNLD